MTIKYPKLSRANVSAYKIAGVWWENDKSAIYRCPGAHCNLSFGNFSLLPAVHSRNPTVNSIKQFMSLVRNSNYEERDVLVGGKMPQILCDLVTRREDWLMRILVYLSVHFTSFNINYFPRIKRCVRSNTTGAWEPPLSSRFIFIFFLAFNPFFCYF